MSKKIELRVQTHGENCKPSIMKTAAKLPGIKSMSMDSEKGVLTIIGTVDVVDVVKKLNKAKQPADVISVGPEKPPEKKPDPPKPCDKKHECGCKPPMTCCYCEIKHECGCKPPMTCKMCEIKHECSCKPPMMCYLCKRKLSKHQYSSKPPMTCYCYPQESSYMPPQPAYPQQYSSYMPPQPAYPQQAVFVDQPPYGSCTIF